MKNKKANKRKHRYICNTQFHSHQREDSESTNKVKSSVLKNITIVTMKAQKI